MNKPYVNIPDEIHSTLYPDLISIHSISSFLRANSFSRLNMFTGHIGQALAIMGATPRKIQTGSEQDYGKYTVNVAMPCDGIILAIIPRYKDSLTHGIQTENPEKVVIYEDIETKQIGYISLVKYANNHPQFGFRYKVGTSTNLLSVGNSIPKNTVFLSSPNVTDEGDWCFGIEANVALCTHPAVAEDGILVSKQFLEKCAFSTYEKRSISWGNKGFPINLYGNSKVYKPFPEIGDRTRDDGLVAAIRPYDPRMVLAEQNMKAAKTVDHTFDEKHYARPNGKVIDVRVITQNLDDSISNEFVKKYGEHTMQFYKAIIAFHDDIEYKAKGRGSKPNLHPKFHNLVVEALKVTASERKETQLTYRQNRLDNVLVEITIEYDTVPTIGFKLTGTNGDKGVVVSVVDESVMPIDQYGVRADVLMEPSISRMNIGRYIEQYINSTSDNVHRQLCAMLNVKPFASMYSVADSIVIADYEKAFNYLLEYYFIINPKTLDAFKGKDIDKVSYLAYIVEKGVGVWYPPDNCRPILRMHQMIEASPYNAPIGPVVYVGNSGYPCKTKGNIRIGSMYIMLLEKIADDKSAVASSKTQVHGALAPITKADKHQYPSREQSSRVFGETEVRIIASSIGGPAVADLMDKDNSHSTHKLVCETILTAKCPTNINKIVDRSIVKFGSHKPLGLARHYLACSGVQFYHIPD